jgi:formylglycine-generating enzyme required for sulfatase activity
MRKYLLYRVFKQVEVKPVKRALIHLMILAGIAIGNCFVFAGYSNIAAHSLDAGCINHGDVNLDGAITAADAQLAFFIVLGTYSPTYEEECAADCNGDGDITAADAQAIFLAVLGLGDCADPLIPGEYEAGDLYSVDNIVGNMRFVPAGTFTQGSPESEPCRMDKEGPQFEHTLTRNVAVMETEISRWMWYGLGTVQSDLPTDPSDTLASPWMESPVQKVTWYEAVLFANLLSLQNGYTPCYYKDEAFAIPVDVTNYNDLENVFYCNFNAHGYRLPTEGEREHFTRAGTTTPFSLDEQSYNESTCGTESCETGTLPTLDDHCVFCSYLPYPQIGPMEVGSKLPNPWNFHDVHGNVEEWCWDRYSETYPAGAVTDYAGVVAGSHRVKRGGKWQSLAQWCRSAFRSADLAGIRYNSIGFRLVRTVP